MYAPRRRGEFGLLGLQEAGLGGSIGPRAARSQYDVALWSLRDVHSGAAQRRIGGQREGLGSGIVDLGSVECVTTAVFAAGDKDVAVGQKRGGLIEARGMHRAYCGERVSGKFSRSGRWW